ncbi:MAG: transketolase [Alphaproteobacteria bacterium]|nr:transketolase [Alphaproteobacteria bacterium]
MTHNTAQKIESQDPKHRDMANAIRALAMDAVQKANSGHPGMPMGMADVATVLFSKFLTYDPRHPEWPDRDRLILSGGHGSMLLYALLYLTGYEQMTLDEIKNFRQLHSKTPGHPELDPACGVEMTTGPLGQGIASAPGFALGERIMANHFPDLMNHYTYVLCGDGDLMEGVSHEACSFAGHMKLSKLIVLFDDNGICIDGRTDMTVNDNTRLRFESYGWDVQEIDGHDPAQIESAIAQAQRTDTPSLICCKTHIGFGAPTKQDSAAAHGSPLGDDEIAGARAALSWPYKPFDIPRDVLDHWRAVGARCHGVYAEWEKALERNRYRETFESVWKGDVATAIAPLIQKAKQAFAAEKPKMATRQTSGKVLESLVPALPFMIGGSADLTGSVNTKVKGPDIIGPDNAYNGQYIHYGVREHGMAAIMNGLALHGGMIPYAGTFLQFADYSRPAIRLGALMKQRVVHVMTHDSIGLGEDGPTHQPVEHLAALRAIPNLTVFRPCDGVETAECWELALNAPQTPSVMVLSRQGMPTVRKADAENLCARGAYVLSDCDGAPDITLFATGSEVQIAMAAKEMLSGKAVRVVSVPSMDLFLQQDPAYQESILCNESKKLAIEAALRQGWDRLIGPHGIFIGMKGFGDSAPAEDLYKHFGITADAVVAALEE